MPSAGADGSQKLDKASVSTLLVAQSNKLLDDGAVYLHLEEFEVVVDQRDDGLLRSDVVVGSSGHGMVEVHVDPLRHVELVLVVVLTDELDQVVGSSADGHDGIASLYFFQVKLAFLKRQVEDVDQRLDSKELPHELLTQHVEVGTCSALVVVVF